MKPYAIITSADLKVRFFDNKDDWKTAVDQLTARNLQYLAFKYHHGAEMYQACEIHTTSW